MRLPVSEYLNHTKTKICNEGVTDPLAILHSMLNGYVGIGKVATFLNKLTRNHVELAKSLLTKTPLTEVLRTLSEVNITFDADGDFIKMLSAFFIVYKDLVLNCDKEIVQNLQKNIIPQLHLSESSRLQFTMPNLNSELPKYVLEGRFSDTLCILDEKTRSKTIEELESCITNPKEKIIGSEFATFKAMWAFDSLIKINGLSENTQIRMMNILLSNLIKCHPHQSHAVKIMYEQNPLSFFQFWANLPVHFLDEVTDQIANFLFTESPFGWDNNRIAFQILKAIWPRLSNAQKEKFLVERICGLFSTHQIDSEDIKPIISDLSPMQRSQFLIRIAQEVKEHDPYHIYHLLNGINEQEAHQLLEQFKDHPNFLNILIHFFRYCSLQDNAMVFEYFMQKFNTQFTYKDLDGIKGMVSLFSEAQQIQLVPHLLSLFNSKHPHLAKFPGDDIFIRASACSVLNGLSLEVLKRYQVDLMESVQALQSDSFSVNAESTRLDGLYVEIFLKASLLISKLDRLNETHRKWLVQKFRNLWITDRATSFKKFILKVWKDFSTSEQDSILAFIFNFDSIIDKYGSTLEFYKNQFDELLLQLTDNQKLTCMAHLTKLKNSELQGHQHIYVDQCLQKIIQSLPAEERPKQVLIWAKTLPEVLCHAQDVDDKWVDGIIRDVIIKNDAKEFSRPHEYKLLYHLAPKLNKNQKDQIITGLKQAKIANNGITFDIWSKLISLNLNLTELLNSEELSQFFKKDACRLLEDARFHHYAVEAVETCVPGFYQSLCHELAELWLKSTTAEKLDFIKGFSLTFVHSNERCRESLRQCFEYIIRKIPLTEGFAFIVMLSHQLAELDRPHAIRLISRLYKIHSQSMEVSATITDFLPDTLVNLVLSYV